MLELQNINTFYGQSHVLHDVSLTVKKSEIVALQGRNGVGKSTTIKTIMGLVDNKRGSVFYKGQDITHLKPYQISQMGIGFVPEERWIFPSLTVYENLLIGMKAQKENEKTWSVERVFEKFPSLKTRSKSKAGNISGGEKQMLTIARTLMGNPELILIDEPTEGLAPLIVNQVAEIIQEINAEGITVFLVEQKLSVSLKLADRVYVMSKGAIMWQGTSLELGEDHEVRKRFLEVGV
ncbi:MAG: ABC transporter ATP-binding protein [Desulfohalobiaceae bacterium]|nr:ABC transporter ATP-binding protein [Desulfohalobiaceae bacterium]